MTWVWAAVAVYGGLALAWTVLRLRLAWWRHVLAESRRRAAEAEAEREALLAARHADLLAMVFCDPVVEAGLERAGAQRAVLEAAIRIEVAWIAYSAGQLEAVGE